MGEYPDGILHTLTVYGFIIPVTTKIEIKNKNCIHHETRDRYTGTVEKTLFCYIIENMEIFA